MTPFREALTLVPRKLTSARANLSGNVVVPARPYPWFYEVRTNDRVVVAKLYIGHGVLLADSSELCRVVKHPGGMSISEPGVGASNSIVSMHISSTSQFGRVCRIILGDDRLGGYVVEGNGWRGSRIRRAQDMLRLADLYSEGDPAQIYHIDPVRERQVPGIVAVAAAYFLTDRDLRKGSWIPRPRDDDQD